MNCLINENVDRDLQKGRKVEVIAQYMSLKYRLKVETAVLLRRAETLKLDY